MRYNKYMKYEIIKKGEGYKIVQNKEGVEITLSRLFSSEQDAIDFIKNSNNSQNVSITKTSKQQVKFDFPQLNCNNFSGEHNGAYRYKGKIYQLEGQNIYPVN